MSPKWTPVRRQKSATRREPQRAKTLACQRKLLSGIRRPGARAGAVSRSGALDRGGRDRLSATRQRSRRREAPLPDQEPRRRHDRLPSSAACASPSWRSASPPPCRPATRSTGCRPGGSRQVALGRGATQYQRPADLIPQPRRDREGLRPAGEGRPGAGHRGPRQGEFGQGRRRDGERPQKFREFQVAQNQPPGRSAAPRHRRALSRPEVERNFLACNRSSRAPRTASRWRGATTSRRCRLQHRDPHRPGRWIASTL